MENGKHKEKDKERFPQALTQHSLISNASAICKKNISRQKNVTTKNIPILVALILYFKSLDYLHQNE